MRRTWFLMGLWLLAGWEGAQAIDCVVTDIGSAGPGRLEALKGVSGLASWVELDEELFVCGSDDALARVSLISPLLRRLPGLAPDRIRMTHGLHRQQIEEAGLRILAQGGRFALVEVPDELAKPEILPELMPWVPNAVLARRLDNDPRGLPARERLTRERSRVQDLVDEVDANRWFADVVTLSTFNRYTYHPEIGAARNWIAQQLRKLPGITVKKEPVDLGETVAHNVVGTMEGKERPDQWYIVGGHYDSTSQNPMDAAPGAEDNASGCAGVLELARIFAASPPGVTVIFICYAAEEIGLEGSTLHAASLVVSEDSDKIQAVLNMDMIGYEGDGKLDCLLEAHRDHQFLLNAFAAAALEHTDLSLSYSNHPAGSDHVPYSREGMPALLSIENDWSIYPHYHRGTDLPEHLSRQMAGEILRMNVAAMAGLMGGGSELSGCLELGTQELSDARVVLKPYGEKKHTTKSEADGCFAFSPAPADSGFKITIRHDGTNTAQQGISGCLTLLDAPLEGLSVSLRQTGEPSRKTTTDPQGCFALEGIAPDNPIKLILNTL